MANLQVKNVPESIHRRVRAYAKRRGRTVRDVVLEGGGMILMIPNGSQVFVMRWNGSGLRQVIFYLGVDPEALAAGWGGARPR